MDQNYDKCKNNTEILNILPMTSFNEMPNLVFVVVMAVIPCVNINESSNTCTCAVEFE